RHPHAISPPADHGALFDTAIFEPKRGERMWRDRFQPLGDRKSGIITRHDKGAVSIPIAREHDILTGDAAIGNQAFGAAEFKAAVYLRRRSLHGGDVGARVRFGKRKS